MNDKVRIHNGKSWKIKGTVIDISKHPRSYIIQTDKGTILRRNRKHILLLKPSNVADQCMVEQESDSEDDCYSLINNTGNRNNPEPSEEQALDQSAGNMDLDLLIGDHNDDAEIPIPESRVTRYGRTIRPPAHLEYYDTS